MLVVANLCAAIILMFFLDFFGVYSGYSKISNFLSKSLPKGHGASRDADLSLIEREEQNKLIESFSMREADLKGYEDKLKSREDNLIKDESKIKQERQNLEAQKKKLAANASDKNAYSKKVQDLADRFYNMPPEKAVERILVLGDDLLILDTLKAIDAISVTKGTASVVPYLYSLMPAADASRLLRLSTAGE
jgi:hypothetical protein